MSAPISCFEHLEKQVSLATTKAQLLVAGLAFLLTAYVRLIVDAGILKILDTTIRNGPTDSLAIVTWLLWALGRTLDVEHDFEPAVDQSLAVERDRHCAGLHTRIGHDLFPTLVARLS